MAKKPTKKQIEDAINRAFTQVFSGIQVPIFELSIIDKRAKKLMDEGKTAIEAMTEIVKDYK